MSPTRPRRRPSRRAPATRLRASRTHRRCAPRASPSTSRAARPATGSPCTEPLGWHRRCTASAPGPVDFYLSTGRMPLEQPREEPQRNSPAFTRPQIDALIAFISSFGGPAAPTADPAAGSLALGFHAFTLSCAGCHQIVARGGITVNAQVTRPAAGHRAADRRGGAHGPLPDAALRLDADRPVRARLDRPLRPVDPPSRPISAAGASTTSARSRRGSWRGSSASRRS